MNRPDLNMLSLSRYTSSPVLEEVPNSSHFSLGLEDGLGRSAAVWGEDEDFSGDFDSFDGELNGGGAEASLK